MAVRWEGVDRRGALLLLAGAAMSTGHAEAADGQRFRAFVVGNDYSAAEASMHLANAQNDARLIAGKLSVLPGGIVTTAYDADAGTFQIAFGEFVQSLTAKDIAIFFFAGHGLQIGGQNYLLLGDGGTLLALSGLIDRIRKVAAHTIVFLDACRTNPFGHIAHTEGASRSLKKVERGGGMEVVRVSDLSFGRTGGLARLELRGTGVLVAFSTDPGNVALDEVAEIRGNSPFSAALAERITTKKSLDEILAEVTKFVAKVTDREQSPWRQGSLETAIYLAGEPSRLRADKKIPGPPP